MKKILILILSLLVLCGCEKVGSQLNVKTDYSKYVSGNNQENVYKRLSNEYIEDLAAGDYGFMLPYAGQKLFEEEDNNSYYSFANRDYKTLYTYGFVSSDGTLLTDPVYTSIDVLTYQDEQGNYHSSGYYIFYKRQLKENEDGYKDLDNYYGIASMDGHYVSECQYEFISCLEDGICFERKDGSYLITDFELNILLDTSKVKEMNGCEYLYLIKDGTIRYKNNGECWLCDLNGNVICGPHSFLSRFYGNLAIAKSEEQFYLIDKQGNRVNDLSFSNFQTSENGYFLVGDEDEYLIDNDGNIVKKFDEDVLFIGKYVIAGKDIYDLDGNLITTVDFNVSGSAYDGTILFSNSQFGKITLYNLISDKEIQIECDGSVSEITDSFKNNGSSFSNLNYLVAHGKYNEMTGTDETDILLNTQLEVLLSDCQIMYVRDEITETDYVVTKKEDSDNSSITVYDAELNELYKTTGYVSYYGNIKIITDTYGTRGYDENNNLIFSYLFGLNGMDD